jgi:hypothetical protein
MGTRWNIVGMFIKEEVTMATIIAQPSNLELRQELDLEGIEQALEEQVQDYFADWPVDDLEEEGRIVFG